MSSAGPSEPAGFDPPGPSDRPEGAPSSVLFADRADAGRRLAERLAAEGLPPPCVVLAVPRGGVLVGAEVARRLQAPLEVLMVYRIAAPWQRDLTVAALVDGDDPQLVVDEPLCATTGAGPAYLDAQAAALGAEMASRRRSYLGGRAPAPLAGATAILVDDGIATGLTARAALGVLRRRRPAKTVLAVPVAPHVALMALHRQCDRIVCLAEPQDFRAVAPFYAQFPALDDADVSAAIDRARR